MSQCTIFYIITVQRMYTCFEITQLRAFKRCWWALALIEAKGSLDWSNWPKKNLCVETYVAESPHLNVGKLFSDTQWSDHSSRLHVKALYNFPSISCASLNIVHCLIFNDLLIVLLSSIIYWHDFSFLKQYFIVTCYITLSWPPERSPLVWRAEIKEGVT